MRLSLALLLGFVLCRPAPARALTCAPPPPEPQVLYPQGGVVPRDVVIYLRPGTTSGRLVLVELGSGREIWLRESAQPGLLRLAPTRLLAAGTRHELRQLAELRSRPPLVLASFHTSQTIHRGGPPSFRRADLSFTRPQRGSMIRREGRGARLSAAADPAPVVLKLQLAFRAGSKWSSTWRTAHAFSTAVRVAATHACDHLRPVAPRRGRYRLVLVPWGPNGVKGRELRLKGVIR